MEIAKFFERLLPRNKYVFNLVCKIILTFINGNSQLAAYVIWFTLKHFPNYTHTEAYVSYTYECKYKHIRFNFWPWFQMAASGKNTKPKTKGKYLFFPHFPTSTLLLSSQTLFITYRQYRKISTAGSMFPSKQDPMPSQSKTHLLLFDGLKFLLKKNMLDYSQDSHFHSLQEY